MRTRKRPEFYFPCDALDLGFTRDPSAWIGGYWDFDWAGLVIEDETAPLYRTRTDALAMAIREKRQALWPGNIREPYRGAQRYKDGTYWNPHTSVGDAGGNGAEKLAELAKDFEMHFIHAEKAQLDTMANGLRKLVASGKLAVHKRCVHLIRQLGTGLWADTSKTDFERSPAGHLDHLAALIYLVRHLPRHLNPYPPYWGVDLQNVHVTAPPADSGPGSVVKKFFG